ncbi:MAG: flagellin, partial [Desulfohalobiaceae bacterium]
YSTGTLREGDTDLELGDVTLEMHKGFEVQFPDSEEGQEGTQLDLYPTGIYQGDDQNKPGVEMHSNFDVRVRPQQGSFEQPVQVKVTSDSTIGDSNEIEYKYSLDQGATWSDTQYAENKDSEAATLHLPGGEVRLEDASQDGSGSLNNLEFSLGGTQVQQTNTKHQAVAVGDFKDKVLVRIDEEVNLDLDDEISYSYSTDQGRTWSEGHKAENTTTWQEYAELEVPGGKLKLTGADSDFRVDTGASRSPSYLEVSGFDPELSDLESGDELSLSLAGGGLDDEKTFSGIDWDTDNGDINDLVSSLNASNFSGNFEASSGNEGELNIETREDTAEEISWEGLTYTRDIHEDKSGDDEITLSGGDLDDIDNFQAGDNIEFRLNDDDYSVTWAEDDDSLNDLAGLMDAEIGDEFTAKESGGDLVIKGSGDISLSDFQRTSQIEPGSTEAWDGKETNSSKIALENIRFDEIDSGQDIELVLSGGGNGEESYELTWDSGDDAGAGYLAGLLNDDSKFSGNFTASESGGELIIETDEKTGEKIEVQEFRNLDTEEDLIGWQQRIQEDDQFIIQPRQAGIDTEISQGVRLQQNLLGPEVFGGHYKNSEGLEPAFESEPQKNLFMGLGKLISSLEHDDEEGIRESLDHLDGAVQQVSNVQAVTGARLNRLESTEDVLTNLELSEKERKGSLEDVDFAELMSQMSQQQTIYQAVLKSSSMIMRMSLVDYI